VASVRVKVGSNAFVAAAKGANGLWSATAPVKGLALGTQTVTVEAKDSSGGTTTVTRPVRVASIVVPAGSIGPSTVSPRSSLVKKSGSWKAFAFPASPDKKGLAATKKNAKLTASVYGRTLTVTFRATKKGGKATFTVDGKKVTVDLYSAKTKNVVRTVTFTSASVGKHSVVITVTGKKAKKSKGTAVSVGSLRVTA
jgi:hypothetical protein